jgi:hypothetical protein
LLLVVVLMLPLAGGFTDDGFIHIQYARNIIEHGEYSFNPGETSFGTTSPLWVLELAAAGRIMPGGDERFIAISRVFSWAAGLAAVVAVYALALALGTRRRTAVLAALTFAADAWFVRWTALSMETSTAVLTVALMGVASVRALDDRRAAGMFGAFLALASLVRPEVYLALPVFVVAAATRWRTCDRRAVLLALTAAGVLLVPWLAFARLHIGSFLPNTAGAKSGGLLVHPVSFFRALNPMARILVSTQGIVMIAAAVSMLLLRSRSRVFDTGARFALLWAISLPVAYAVLGIQVLSRYLLLVTPMVCALAWVAIEQLVDERVREGLRGRVTAAVAGVAVAANVILYVFVVVPPSRAFTADLLGNMKSTALYLRNNSPEDAVVAAADIGYLAFYSRRRVLDLGGLVEPKTGRLREAHSYEEIVDRGLYFGIAGYPHVDYFIDRELVPSRFDGTELAGHRFQEVYATTVRNLGIRKPGPYHYTLYRVTPVE